MRIPLDWRIHIDPRGNRHATSAVGTVLLLDDFQVEDLEVILHVLRLIPIKVRL